MSYQTLAEINSNPQNAPLGLEEQYNLRIEKEQLFAALTAMDENKTIYKNNIPAKYYEIITDLVCPYNQQHVIPSHFAEWRRATDDELLCTWDGRPERWAEWGTKFHRHYLYERATDYFEELLEHLNYLQ